MPCNRIPVRQPRWKRHARRAGCFLWCIGILFLFRNCASLRISSGTNRAVRLKVVVNPDFASHSAWRSNVENLIDVAGTVFGSWAEISFIIDTMLVWDIEKAPSYGEYFLHDCLVKEIGKDNSDLVVYLARTTNRGGLLAGLSMYDLGYIYTEMRSGTNVKGSYEKAFHTLVHELGHVFGAVHVYFDKNAMKVMNPFLHGRLVEKTGMRYRYVEPEFHPGNMKIMLTLNRRAFAEDRWDAAQWDSIVRTYTAVRKEFNPWRFTGGGELEGYEFDEFHEGDIYLFLSTWASLCGNHDKAHAYADSLEMLWEAIRTVCVRHGGVGSHKICSQCGAGEQTASHWLELHTSMLQGHRAGLFLREREFDRADSCHALFMDSFPDELVSEKIKFENGYVLRKNRYAIPAGGRNGSGSRDR